MEVLLEASWAVLGSSWPSWSDLWASGGPLGPSGRCGELSEHLSGVSPALLEPTWRILQTAAFSRWILMIVQVPEAPRDPLERLLEACLALFEPSWELLGPLRALKALLEASWRVTRSVQAAFRLSEASWSAPGGLQSRKKIVQEGPGPVKKKFQDRFQPKEIHLNPSWPVLKKFQDRFQPSWGPKGLPKAAQEGPNSSSGCDSSSKHDFFKKYRFFTGIPGFSRS